MLRPDLDGIRLRLRNNNSGSADQIADFHLNAAADITQLLNYIEHLETEYARLAATPELRRGHRA